MIELLKVEVTNLPHIYERKIKEAVAMVTPSNKSCDVPPCIHIIYPLIAVSLVTCLLVL